MCNWSPNFIWKLCKILHKSTLACAQFHKSLFKGFMITMQKLMQEEGPCRKQDWEISMLFLIVLKTFYTPLSKTVNIFFAYYKKR